MTLKNSSSLPQLRVIYNLNFIKVISAFFMLLPSLRYLEEFKSLKNTITPTTFFFPSLFSCLQHCYSNKYTKLNRICIEIGLKTLFPSLTALSLLLELNTKNVHKKTTLSELHFSIYSREHLYRLM